MAEEGSLPQFTDAEAPPIIKQQRASAPPRNAPTRARSTWLSGLDIPLLVVLTLLIAIGSLMIYSTTFNWGYVSFGSDTYFLGIHARNLLIGGVFFVLTALINYRVVKRFAVLLLLIAVGSLIAVLVFSDVTFGARRAFLGGSYQPGELAELIIVIYMAAWLGSKNTKVGSILNGLIPFAIIVGGVGVLVMLQPDLSTAATIFITAGLMFFLAGANLLHLGAVLGLLASMGIVIGQQFAYTETRLATYIAGLSDLTQTNYHAQQAFVAFYNGGWTGLGLGQSLQKFGALPTPHTDSIFAVIGEELGALGAMFVIGLYVLLAMRGLTIARRARDPFGALLASGVTLWIITKALMNIAVMVNILPSTGVALPFISYGGSSLVTVMVGAGLLFSIARVTAQETSPEGRSSQSAPDDRGWGNRWSRVPGAGSSRSARRSIGGR